MKCIDHVDRTGPKTNMKSTRDRYSVGTQIDPELRIFLPEADGSGPCFKSDDPNCGEEYVIETCRCRDVTYRDRDVINQAGAPDLTSLKTMESINA